jgi:propionyl-CoA carboxylase beta chain
MEALGGAKVHSQISGLADKRVKTEDDCYAQIRDLLSYLPSNNKEQPPRIIAEKYSDQVDEDIGDMIPTDPRKSYDMRQIITRILDERKFLEIKEEFAKNIVTGFGRLNGYSVGVIANQPLHMAGSLTIDSSDKEARFIRFCDAFNIPLLFLVDTTGFLPGVQQEHGGILRHGAKVLYAISESVVPKMAVLVRKAYGGAKPAMGIDKDIGIDCIYAWPTGESAIMGAEAVAEVIYGKEISGADNPEQFKERKIKELKEAATPYPMVYGGLVDDIIEPGETRRRLCVNLELLIEKKEIRYPKRHGNIPL